MADIPASNWTEADASNSTAAPDGWPEGMAPSGVNDAGRAMMGAIKRWYDWTVPLVTGGTSTAYTLSYAVSPGALVDGMSHLVQFNAVNGAAPTLNVNTLGAKPLHFYSGGAWGAFPANIVAVDQIVRVTYNAAAGTYRAIGMPMVLNQSVSGVAAIDFVSIPINVNNLEIRFDLTTATNNDILLLQFYNSAGVLDAGATAYYYAMWKVNPSGANGAAGSVGVSGIVLGNAISNSTVIRINGTINVNDIQAVKSTQCTFQTNWFDQAGADRSGGSGYGARSANGNITGIRIVTLAGANLTGTVTVAAK